MAKVTGSRSSCRSRRDLKQRQFEFNLKFSPQTQQRFFRWAACYGLLFVGRLICCSRRKKEEGRRKKEEAIKSIVSAINNVLTVLAVAIFDFPFIPRKVRRSDSRLWCSVRTLQLTVNSQQSTVNNHLDECTL